MYEDGLASRGQPARDRLWGDAARRGIDRAVLRSLAKALRTRGVGSVQLALPSGEFATLGSSGPSREVRLTINRYRALWSVLRGGSLNNSFSETYDDARSAARGGFSPTYYNSITGFRCSRPAQ